MKVTLALNTSSENSEIVLIDEKGATVASNSWVAHKQLAATIHQKIDEILDKNSLTYNNIISLSVYNGSGSFTGLRIGIAVANSIAYSLQVPISSYGDSRWKSSNVPKDNNSTVDFVIPKYDKPAFVTVPKK